MEIASLERELRGKVIPSSDGVHAETQDSLIWNARKPPRNSKLIVRAACAEDVQHSVRFAARHGLSVSARGGGHHFTGIAARGDMIIDLSGLDGLQIEPDSRKARIEPGVTNARLATALGRHDLAFPVGHCGSVPVSGYLLGGGVGWNSGAWGIACSSVEAVEVVMADGQLLLANDHQHQDIFWAARGAGARFFGIVTAYHVRLHEAPKAILTTVRFYPLDAARRIALWAEAAMAGAPASVEFTTQICSPPPELPTGGMVLAAIATVFAGSEAEGRAILARLGENAPAGALHIMEGVPTPFDVLYHLTAQSLPEGRRYAVDSMWSNATYAEVLEQVAAAMSTAPSPASMALVMLRPPSALEPGDAAFSCIGRIFSSVYTIWDDSNADAANIGWLRRSMDDIGPLGHGTYAGETDLDRGPRHLKTHSAAAAARISELSGRYDPAGLFACPQALSKAA